MSVSAILAIFVSLSLAKDCQKRSRVSVASGPSCTSLTCRSPLTAYFLPYFPLDSFNTIDFPASFPRVQFRSCCDARYPPAHNRIPLLIYAKRFAIPREREPLFRRGKKRRKVPAACISRPMAPNLVGSLSEVDRPMPRTILESGSRRGLALSASHSRIAPRPSFSRASRLDLGPSHAPLTPRGSSSSPRVEYRLDVIPHHHA